MIRLDSFFENLVRKHWSYTGSAHQKAHLDLYSAAQELSNAKISGDPERIKQAETQDHQARVQVLKTDAELPPDRQSISVYL